MDKQTIWDSTETISRIFKRATRIVAYIARANRGICEPFVQDALVQAWELNAERDEKRLTSEIVRAAFDKLRAEWRKERRHISRDDDDGDEKYDRTAYATRTEAHQINDLYLKELNRAIALLPHRQRSAVELMIDGLNMVDIGIRLNIPIYTVARRINTARSMLWRNGLIEAAMPMTGVPS